MFCEYSYDKTCLFWVISEIFSTQLTFTCSKSTIETLEKAVKYVQS